MIGVNSINSYFRWVPSQSSKVVRYGKWVCYRKQSNNRKGKKFISKSIHFFQILRCHKCDIAFMTISNNNVQARVKKYTQLKLKFRQKWKKNCWYLANLILITFQVSSCTTFFFWALNMALRSYVSKISTFFFKKVGIRFWKISTFLKKS